MNEKQIDEYSEDLYKQANRIMTEMLLILRENVSEDLKSTEEAFTLATIMLAVISVGLYREENPEMAMVLKNIAVDMFSEISGP